MAVIPAETPIALFRCDTCDAYRLGGEEVRTQDDEPVALCRVCGCLAYEVGEASLVMEIEDPPDAETS